MKKNNFKITNCPTNCPKIIEINMIAKKYSEVKLFVPKVNGKPSVLPNKKWYVYFYFENPITKKRTSKFTFTCDINRLKKSSERKIAGKKWVEVYQYLLQNGFDPFTKNGIEDKTIFAQFEPKQYTIEAAFNYAFDNKIGTWKEATISDYKTRMNVFLNWIERNDLNTLLIEDLKEVHIITFMNWLVSPSGRNIGKTSQDNYKRCLSGLFSKMVQDKIITKNLMLDIVTKKDDPIKNTPFTGYEVKAIRDYLLIHDKQLYRFIQFVIFTFLRPREIIRLKCGDFNVREQYLSVETKTKRKQIKKLVAPIIEFCNEINITNLPKEAHLFTNTEKYEVWNAIEKTKVDLFAKRFNAVKLHFGFSAAYGIYSFRHTAAMDLYYSFMKQGLTEREAILKLMPITGHATEAALRNYLRDVGGMLPKDYGSDYTLEF